MAQSDNTKPKASPNLSRNLADTPDNLKDGATPEEIRELVKSGKLKQYDTLDELWHDLNH